LLSFTLTAFSRSPIVALMGAVLLGIAIAEFRRTE
jgi:hypothetical protein